MIALSIAAVAMVTVLGLMPVGLGTMREAAAQTVEAQIVQGVASGASLQPFDKLASYSAQPYYFTGSGTPQTAKDADTRFIVTLSQGSTVFPGSAEAKALGDSLRTFVVETARTAGGPIVSRATNVIHVANSGL